MAKGSASDPGEAHVALLRGVNLGGKNKLPMARLAALFAANECREVRTYIQSGNVVFKASQRVAEGVTQRISGAIEREFGLRVPVVLRSARELSRAVQDNPYLRQGVDPNALHAMFLASAPSEAQLAKLDPARSPGDTFSVRGKDVYLHLPNGVARSKLSNAYFDGALQTVSTMRNWRTVLKLLELCGG